MKSLSNGLLGTILLGVCVVVAQGCATGVVKDSAGDGLSDVDVIAFSGCRGAGCEAHRVEVAVGTDTLTGYHAATNGNGQYFYDGYAKVVAPEEAMFIYRQNQSPYEEILFSFSKSGYQGIWLYHVLEYEEYTGNDGEKYAIAAVPEMYLCRDDESDSDGDTICDAAEGFYGTSPFDADTDGDGVNDDEEIFGTATPVSVDLDVTLSLNGVAAGQIFQRDSDNQSDVTIEGVHIGDVTPIEARVVVAGTENAVVDWTVIDSNPVDGVFSGVLGVPQGGWYQIQVRGQNASTSLIADPNQFGVGVLIACTGQSHIDYWFDLAYGQGAPVASELARMYRHDQVLQAGAPWTGWQPVTGMGATVFANKLVETLGVPVGLLDYGVQGASLWQSNGLHSMFGWWIGDDSGLYPTADNYAVFKEGLDSIGNRIEAVLWIQGHTDAMQGESTETYKLGLDGIFELMRTDTGVADLPIFTSLVTRQSTTSDVNIQNIRNAEVQKIDEDPRNYLGCTTMDLPLTSDNIHHTPDGQRIQAERLAQAVLHTLVNAGDYTYHRGPQIEGYEIVNGTTIDIEISHNGGTDFTPVSGIKGFEVFGAEVGDITSAVKYDADTIRLTLGGNTAGLTSVTYSYGANPDDQDLNSYVAGYVHDNSALALPLEGAYVQEILP